MPHLSSQPLTNPINLRWPRILQRSGSATASLVAAGLLTALLGALQPALAAPFSGAPSITVTPASTVYTGGVPTTLYLGYGAQSATLAASGGYTSYTWAPATGLSNHKVANPVFTAAAPGVYWYTVTVTDQDGNETTATVTMRVADARCGNKNDKVQLCHNGHEICVAPSAVAAHLRQHPDDKLASCTPDDGTSTPPGDTGVDQSRGGAPGTTAPAASELVFEAYPNPVSGATTTVHFRPAASADARIRVYDGLGRVVATLFAGPAEAGRDYQLPLNTAALTNGVYLCRYESNGRVSTQRLTVVR